MKNTNRRCEACGAYIYADEQGNESCRCKDNQDRIDERRGK